MISFILVEPARPENIGAAARAMKTMGFGDLRLVNPCAPDPRAHWVAHESGDILDSAEQFPSLEAALADTDFSIATTARRRLSRDDYLSPGECAEALTGKAGSVARAALVFGRESSGLTSEELALCDAASSIPLAVAQPSLNLGQAVMLYAWELHRIGLNAETPASAATATLERTRSALDQALSGLGLEQHRRLRRWALEGLARFSDRDLGLLMTVLQRLDTRHRQR